MARRTFSSKNRSLARLIADNTGSIDPTAANVDSAVPHTLDVSPETFTINVDAPGAGSSPPWLWTWDPGTVAYARVRLTNQEQSNVPLYKKGSYTVNNFAAHDTHGDMTQTHKIYLKWIDGAGTQNNVSWMTSTLNVAGQTNPNINGGAATEIQRLSISVPENFTIPTLTNPTVTYNVTNSGSGAYVFSGPRTGNNVAIGPVRRGGTYTFSVNASGHPFYLTTLDSASYSSGTYAGEYTTGVTGSRTETGNLVWTVDSSAPDTMYYACGNHASMFGTINVKDLTVDSNGSGLYQLYFQHDQEGHKTAAEIREVPTIPGNVCLVYNASTNQFEPQDLGIYMDNTTQFREKIIDLVTNDTTQNFVDSAELNTELTSRLKSDTIFNITLYQQDDLSITTGTARWYAPFNLSVTSITPQLGTAADNTVTVLVKKNGSTAKTINFTTGQTTSTVSSPTISMNEGDYLTLDVTAIGSSAKGKDLNVQFKYKRV